MTIAVRLSPSSPPTAARLFASIVLVAAVAAAPAVAATTTTDLLAPYLELDLDGRGRTSLVAVGNHGDVPVRVEATLTTDWGIPVLRERLELPAGGVATINLRDWVLHGRLPSRTLPADERAHLAAALSGRPSPRDGLLYGSAGDGSRAVGALTLRLVADAAGARPPVLWGDLLRVDPRQDRADGGRLVDLGPDGGALCDHHLLRFLDGAGFDGGTELVVWSPRRRQPVRPGGGGAVAAVADDHQIAIGAFYGESGERSALRELDLAPVSVVDVGTLGLADTAGWIDLISDGPVYVAARYRSENRYAVGIETWCRRAVAAGIGAPASVTLEKLTEGEDADAPPGAILEARQEVTWTYVVTNSGGVPLSGVTVTDRPEGPVPCPKRVLAPGESMVCTKRGVAIDGGHYDNLGTVVATPPEGPPVEASDPSHYFVPRPFRPESIDLELAVNGLDADLPPGPAVPVGSPVVFSYAVTNTGNVRLTGIRVGDSRLGSVPCPLDALDPGESMTCSLAGVAAPGLYATEAFAVGTPPTGQPVEDRDPSHYTGI